MMWQQTIFAVYYYLAVYQMHFRLYLSQILNICMRFNSVVTGMYTLQWIQQDACVYYVIYVINIESDINLKKPTLPLRM